MKKLFLRVLILASAASTVQAYQSAHLILAAVGLATGILLLIDLVQEPE